MHTFALKVISGSFPIGKLPSLGRRIASSRCVLSSGVFNFPEVKYEEKSKFLDLLMVVSNLFCLGKVPIKSDFLRNVSMALLGEQVMIILPERWFQDAKTRYIVADDRRSLWLLHSLTMEMSNAIQHPVSYFVVPQVWDYCFEGIPSLILGVSFFCVCSWFSLWYLHSDVLFYLFWGNVFFDLRMFVVCFSAFLWLFFVLFWRKCPFRF